MTADEVALGPTLRELREFSGKTLKAVAEPSGISTAYLQKLERGEVKSPSPKVLHGLAQTLGANYLELMRRAGRLSPFEDIRREDAEQVIAALTSLDRDLWAQLWSRIGLGYEAKGDEGESSHAGLGLWIVRRNIEAIGGQVTATNRSGGGLMISAILPAGS